MTNAERGLLIAIAEGLRCRLVNAGGTGYQFQADKLKLAVEVARREIEDEQKMEEKPVSYENRSEMTVGLDWDDAAVTFAQNFAQDGYDVEVCDHDGVIVKTFVYLHEWSGHVTPLINERDAQGLIDYLIGLNTTTEGERDGTTIRR